jgi:hypothetical protein
MASRAGPRLTMDFGGSEACRDAVLSSPSLPRRTPGLERVP